MLRSFFHRVFRLRRHHPIPLVFVVGREPEIDPVAAFSEMCKSLNGDNYCVVKVQKRQRSLADHLVARNPHRNRLAVFAHSSKNGVGFDIYGDVPLTAQYWCVRPGPFELIYVHSCYGWETLSRPAWAQIAKSVVSYEGEIFCFLGTRHAYAAWERIVNRIPTIVSSSQSSREAVLRMCALYNEELDSLESANAPGTQLIQMYLLHARERLRWV